MTTPMMIRNWFIGDMRQHIPPMCTLDSKNVMFISRGNSLRSKMIAFMRIVEKEARAKDVWIEKISDWDNRSVTKMWDAIKADFMGKYGNTKRKKELAWTTVYNNMSKQNAFENRRKKANN